MVALAFPISPLESSSARTVRLQPAHTHLFFTALPNQEQISRRAYDIYVRNGCRGGMEAEDWLQAERELLTEAIAARNGAGEESLQEGNVDFYEEEEPPAPYQMWATR